MQRLVQCGRAPGRLFTTTQLAFAVALALRLATVTTAQLPVSQLDGVFPAGASPNSTVEITIAGVNLDETISLRFSHPNIKAVQKLAEKTPFDDEPVPVENVFTVTVGGDVPAGSYEVRSLGKYGLSNARSFTVDTLNEVMEVEPNGTSGLPLWKEVDDGSGGKKRANEATELTLPAVANGQSTGGADVDWFRFKAKGGDRILIDCFAKRVDSRNDLVMTLYNSDGNVIGEGRTAACGDPMIDAKLAADGEYFVKVHDILYRNGPGFHYRLRIGAFPHLDFVFPPVGQPGSNDEYTLYGSNLPGGTNSNWSVAGKLLEMTKVRIAIPDDVNDKLQFSSLLGPHQGGIDGIEYRLGDGNAKSNPVLITAATAPIVLEQADNDRPESMQKLSLPCEVAGQFFPQFDKDWYAFEAKKDEVWAIDLVSQRLGLTTDPSLLIQRIAVNDAGETQISDVQFIDDLQEQNFNNQSGRHEFDYRSSDPSYIFTAPADGTYRILVKDGQSAVKSDPRLVYRLAIRKPIPDYRIVAVPAISSGSMLLRRGGRTLIRVFAFRQDKFNGEIRVNCTGLPQGVTSEEIVIGPANTMGTLVLTATADAPPSVSNLQVASKSMIDGKELVRNARYGTALEPFQFAQPNSNLPSVNARIASGISLCVTDYDPVPVKLTIGDGQPLETSRGGILKIPYQLTKAPDASANIAGFPIDFPPQTNAQQVNIGGNEKGEFTLNFQAATIPGTYTFYLAGFNQGVQYKRNPELAEQAVKRQERIAKIFMDAQQKTRDTQQASNTKQQELQAATNGSSQANAKATQTAQGAKTAEGVLKRAEEMLKQQQDAAAAKPEDEGLKSQVAKAQSAVDDAKKKFDEATLAAVEAVKAKETADAAKTAAELAKTQADQSLKEAREFEQRAQQEKQRADQFANQKKTESNPRGINYDVPSNSLTFKITEFPLRVEDLAEELTIKQGEKIEAPLKLARLYDFKSNVNLQGQLPGGVGGISLQSINISEGQAEGKFEINAQPNATVGTHKCTVRLQMNFNGNNLTMEHPFRLTVVEVKPQ